MFHIYDRATIAHAFTADVDPSLRTLLDLRFASLIKSTYDLSDDTEYLIVDDPGDSEDDIIRHIGQSPLINPLDGIRFGNSGFHPHWDCLIHHPGWFEMILTFGSTFAYILLIKDADGILPELLALCRCYA